MGTSNDTPKLQQQLKGMLNKAGFTQPSFSDHYFENIINSDGTHTDHEATQFREKFKKHLQRKTTPPETIQGYMDYLQTTDEYRKACGIKMPYIAHKVIDSETRHLLENLSKEITISIKKKHNTEKNSLYA